MNQNENKPFGTWAKVYRERGLWPRPLRYPGINPKTGEPLGKSCFEKGWQKPDSEQEAGALERWDAECTHWNIGLVTGTLLEDGTRFGAFDIDHDLYRNLGIALFRNPISARIGKKGIVIFVRVVGDLDAHPKFSVKGEANAHLGQVAEGLFRKTLCVIPPSIHPNTGKPYCWVGTPLHDVDFMKLPLIGE